jgi:glyoxylase-like metal-dependent hydrolase (beta-lactamase superfamily II)
MMEEGLALHGLGAEEIDVVIMTHLHTDHAAGAVKLQDGAFVPRFPNARYILDKTEFDRATNPDERSAAVYVPDRYHALVDAGLVDMIDGEAELFPGIRAVPTGGHSEGHFALEIESEDQQVWYYADIFATSAHMGVAYVPATDLFPLDTMAVKRRVLPRVLEENVVMAYDHDVNIPLGRVRQEGRKYVVTPVDE